MRNPLNRRLWRELKGELGKYLVIFLLMAGSIGLISGFEVADNSMLTAYNNSFEDYLMENGHFRVQKKANRAQRKAMEALGITVYENFYTERSLDNGSTLRIFRNRDRVNRVCLMEGELPVGADEIAVDRMYADNNGLKMGDTLTGNDIEYRITGLVALPDYSALFQNNSDSMFDAVLFGVAVVSTEAFANLGEDELIYSYSWRYHEQPGNEAQEKILADDLMDALGDIVHLKEFVPRYLNQAICFTGDDMGKDGAMMLVLLYIIIAILAFVFSITISNTIMKEANVIGTLLASGYTRRELVRHYMTMPMLVTLVSAVLGNLIGYTVLKDFCASLYYGSYSLPTFVTIWNGKAFVQTTLVPVILMGVINYGILRRKLSLSPLKFLRRDLSRKKNIRPLPLSHRIRFLSRFRIRVIRQNLGNYITMFVGIFFACFLLFFGLMLPALLVRYQEDVPDMMFADYQYMLTIPDDMLDEDRKLESLLAGWEFSRAVETKNPDAEKFSVGTLKSTDERYLIEDVTLYGIESESRYVTLDVTEGQVWASAALAQKHGLQVGDTVRLKEAYEDKCYSFVIDGIYDYEGSLSLFMSREKLNEILELDKDFFAAYFSSSEITDIDPEYIGTVIDLTTMTKITRQLMVSMGEMMYMVDAFAVIMFVILIYLLSKLIIEKNAQSISMTKILGYTGREIAGLYLVPTTLVVVASILISLPLLDYIMNMIWKLYLLQAMTGWITYHTDPAVRMKVILLGIASYGTVAILEYRRIRRIPMDMALKNVE